ncbi:hypothetical protein [Sciscionella marina]|uniref:hypothetical protein n=1 Tax=Sciscionella marina TaxID=508770 RepID=UPI0003777D8C|nr:hypothetical protein [Sciscionella marina]
MKRKSLTLLFGGLIATTLAWVPATAFSAEQPGQESGHSAPAQLKDHCTGFCTNVHNGLRHSVKMWGNDGTIWVPPGKWSSDVKKGFDDVDWIKTPKHCTVTFRGKTYHSGQHIRVHGWSPWVWMAGSC